MAKTRERRSGRPRRALAVTAWITAAVILLGAGGLAFVYLKLNGNLRGIDINGLLGEDRPADVDDGSLDILVLGSDSRNGHNRGYGDDGESGSAARSDTAMVVHLARGHKRVSVVSIPRDTLIERPPCRRAGGRGGTAPAAGRSMFNEAYAVGGPACSVKTVEAMTGIRMDHFVEVDFAGFKKLVNALGGVTVTTSDPIHDRRSRLLLPPGTHHLKGEQALGFVRTRHGRGDGSDLGRIELQQQFLTGLLRQVHRTDLFGSPGRLYKVADAATRALTTDSDLASVKALSDLADSMRGIRADDLDTVMLPVDYDRGDPNRVVPKEPEAEQVWAALRADEPVPRSATRTRPERAAAADRGAGLPSRDFWNSWMPRLDPQAR